MLLLTWLHQRLVLPMADAGRLAAWVPRALRGAWLLWVPVAVALSVVAVPLSGITVAMAVTASLLCALYGDVLERRLTGRTRTSSTAKVLLLPAAHLGGLLGLSSGWRMLSAREMPCRSPPILDSSWR